MQANVICLKISRRTSSRCVYIESVIRKGTSSQSTFQSILVNVCTNRHILLFPVPQCEHLRFTSTFHCRADRCIYRRIVSTLVAYCSRRSETDFRMLDTSSRAEQIFFKRRRKGGNRSPVEIVFDNATAATSIFQVGPIVMRNREMRKNDPIEMYDRKGKIGVPA